MSETPILSDAKRALLEKYLRGDVPPAPAAVDTRREGFDSTAAETRERVVPIQTTGSRPPFFFLHGQWEAGGFFCYQMASALGPDRPFYAVEPYRFDGLSVPPPFDAIAAAHLKSMRAMAPEGPYSLGGWCNGALLAYEMARQLHAQGQEVSELVLMDPVYLRYPARLRFVRGTIRLLGASLGVGEGKQLELYLWLRQSYRRLQHMFSYARSAEYRRSNGFAGPGREDYPGIYDWAAMGYRPADLYPGKITFFWSVTQPFRQGWRSIEAANETEIQVLPCGHMNCLDEYLDDLTERLRKSLIGSK